MPFLETSRHILRVWLARARVSIVREMEFRTNFILGLIRQLLWLGSFLLFIHVIFARTDSLSGWSQGEVLVVLALSRLIEGILNALFTQNIAELPRAVQKGEFDFYLVKPVPVQFYMAFKNFAFYQIGNITAGAVLLAYALYHLNAVPSFVQWGVFIFITLLGIIIYYSLLILISSLVFFVDRLEALWGFLVLLSEPLTVPFDIFPRTSRIALTYLIPIAFVVYVPAQTLTNRFAWWQLGVAMVITFVLVLLSNVVWRAGLRRYTSASS